MAEICVIGAGPAGCVFAARMAQLGHDVSLVEREAFPRSRLGKSLSPGVQPLLAAAGLEGALDDSRARPIRNVSVDWEDGPRQRIDTREQGLVVDPGALDLALVERARAFGVAVLQPARVLDRRREGGRWRLAVEVEGRREPLMADFVAEAGGRAGAAARPRQQTGAQTLAIYAYWRGARLPSEPRIAAGDEAWFWGVPLPNGAYNTLAFVDPKSFRAGAGGLAERFLARLAQSPLMQDCRHARLIGAPRAVDATPYIVSGCVGPDSIRLGDAALAIDPISSSGVQKAVQSALTGAVVANTLLRRPAAADLAMGFYLSQLKDASESHQRWAADHYWTVATTRGGSFWSARASGRQEPGAPSREAVDAQHDDGHGVRAFAGRGLGRDGVSRRRIRQRGSGAPPSAPRASGGLPRRLGTGVAPARSSRPPHAIADRPLLVGSDAARIRPCDRGLARQPWRAGEIRRSD